jgi:O-acetyl-ADP-ribose deacetylase (regulator of RNase III)
MIEEGYGNLLTADVDAVVNTVNTVGVMGKGIALQFKRAYPANYAAYRAACQRGDVRLGQMFVFDTAIKGPRRYIINFPTKGHWKADSRLADIESGLDDLVRVVTEHSITSLAIPALGCGNSGLDWARVRPLIEAASLRMPQARVVLFAPDGAPAADRMPNATSRPPLNQLRALLLVAIGRYLDRARLQEVRDGVSELEIQKLAYFLKVLGSPYPLKFTRGHYGPYAEQLRHVLDRVEGHYLIGLGDHSARVTDLAPINLTPGSREQARSALDGYQDDLRRLDELLELVEGFETPYSLELLATVHFAAQQDPATADVDELSRRVTDWNLRKALLFTDRHVRVAAQRLSTRGLLAAADSADRIETAESNS